MQFLRSAAFLASALALAVGCAAEPPVDAPPDRLRLGDVDVQLVDPLALTEAILPVPPNLSGPFMQGIEAVPGETRDRIVPWTGGDCDVATTLTLRREGGQVVISVRSVSRPPPGVLCTLGGRLSAIVIRFREDPPPLILDLGP